MTPEQIDLVQSSWAKVAPQAKETATLFYGRLFEIAPEVKPLFPTDMEEQGKKLMQVLGMAVGSLTKLEELLPTVKQLGVKHVDYGVEDVHYDSVGAALLWTLEQGLGDDFTPETKEAWTITYVTLADVMKGAAAEAA